MPVFTASSETTDYLNELTPFLAHLPPDDFVELLEELAIHLESLLEVAEVAGDGRALRRIVGEPRQFVTEYCIGAHIAPPASNAGLPGNSAGFAGDVEHGTADGPISLLLQRLQRGLSTFEERVLGRNTWRGFVEFLPELAPAWWVARAVLLTMVLGEIFGGDGASRFGQIPLPKLFGSTVVGLGAAVWLSAKSVGLGRRGTRTFGFRFGNVVVAVVSFLALGTIAFAAASPQPESIYVDHDPIPYAEEVVDTHRPALEIHNIYAFDAAGNPVPNVRLFDQDGRPIELDYGAIDLQLASIEPLARPQTD